jgi:hypothetical protein
LQILGQIGEPPIGKALRRYVDDEQAARRAFGQRNLRDQFGRKLVMKVGFFQESALPG